MEPRAGASSARTSSTNRLPGLDLLRAVAIIWVLLYHASVAGLVSPASWIVGFGWMGVDLFFALSGFLIAGQLLRPWARGAKPNYRRFFARRLLRTLPAYLAIVALYFLIPAVRERPEIQPLWQFLTFTENFDVMFPLPKAFSHAWSLRARVLEKSSALRSLSRWPEWSSEAISGCTTWRAIRLVPRLG
jgi:peptidoglycan/LPS O-acetylase OafA/YrhL